MFTIMLRVICCILLFEAGHWMRGAALGAFAPDLAVAIGAAIAVAGKYESVLPASIIIILLTLPATAADPFATAGAMLAFFVIVREARTFVVRDRPGVVFLSAALGVIVISIAQGAAGAARGEAAAAAVSGERAGAALATGAASVLCVPIFRMFTLTRGLLERRFGE